MRGSATISRPASRVSRHCERDSARDYRNLSAVICGPPAYNHGSPSSGKATWLRVLILSFTLLHVTPVELSQIERIAIRILERCERT